jgi:SAM-dependent methyltransferase
VTDDNLAATATATAYADVETYDATENDDGIAFYTDLAQETGGPVLDIACGTGRVTIPIAHLGLTVTGLDVVPQMLDQARRKAASAGLPIRWVEADARTIDLGETFRFIFLTGNAFQQFLTNADQDALLRRVFTHLHDEGTFAFETRNPVWSTPATHAAFTARIEQSRQNGGFFTFLETRDEKVPWQTFTAPDGRQIHESLTQSYDPISQILRLTSYQRWHNGASNQSDQEDHTTIGHESLRFTFPQELAALLTHHGFTIIHHYGDWDRSPLTPTSRSIIVVCRKAPEGL